VSPRAVQDAVVKTVGRPKSRWQEEFPWRRDRAEDLLLEVEEKETIQIENKICPTNLMCAPSIKFNRNSLSSIETIRTDTHTNSPPCFHFIPVVKRVVGPYSFLRHQRKNVSPLVSTIPKVAVDINVNSIHATLPASAISHSVLQAYCIHILACSTGLTFFLYPLCSLVSCNSPASESYSAGTRFQLRWEFILKFLRKWAAQFHFFQI